jgi:signal peptidase I
VAAPEGEPVADVPDAQREALRQAQDETLRHVHDDPPSHPEDEASGRVGDQTPQTAEEISTEQAEPTRQRVWAQEPGQASESAPVFPADTAAAAPAAEPAAAPYRPGSPNLHERELIAPASIGVAEPPAGIRLTQVTDELVAWVKTLASAAVYAILIVTFGFQVARVEGQSMAPTLEDQDRLIVNKLVYRIGEPRRGDIVMLYYPLNPEKSFVKRVIAEEGDTVRIVDGRVYVNDIPLKDDYVPSEYRSHDDWGPQVIPEGYYFVMGDHRNNSSDSRHWGMVPKKYIIGKVQLRWWPVPSARVF